MQIKEFKEDFSSICEAVLITDPKNIYYFTGFYPHSTSYLIIDNDGILKLLVPELEYEDAIENSRESEVIKINNEEPLTDFLNRTIIEPKEIKSLGFENEYMTVSTYLALSQKLKAIQLISITELLNSMRAIKTLEEVEYLKKTAQIAEIGVRTAVDSIEQGKSEMDIAGEAEYSMRKAGSEKISFDTIIASGSNSALPHAMASERKIQKGDLIIIDLGATYKGYCSDITRTVCFGEPSEKQQEIYNLVLKAHKKAVNFAKAGVSAKEIDKIARTIIEQAGYQFIHSLGHGVGLDVHENPTISFKNEKGLTENNVITIEPAIYIPGFGGVRIEDMYQVLKNKLKSLTNIFQEFSI